MIALVLVAALNCGNTATQVDLNACAAAAQSRNDKRELVAFQAAEWRSYDDPLLRLTELRWRQARASACNFVYAMYADGTMAGMLFSQCNADAALARVRDVGLFTGLANPAAAIPDPRVRAEHQRVYGLLELLITPHERDLLANSERAFLRYRDVACSHAKNGCATALTKTRTQQLEDSWLAERFW
ncbi:MAG TPA: lysozyme inhibitor LprI family protein [Candidatus Acidoferrales bacterium]|nr:lysozyme inhibitor LprI family protein [Candidatus Acidoferrales bacterium]